MVDDERIVSLDIQGALVRLGYEVAGAASTGEEALRLARQSAPDLVLMDVRLDGGMDGAEAALRIGQAHDAPVVFLTAYSDEGTMRRALSAAPFGYLIKPFEDRELKGVIELALAKHKVEQDLKRARRAAEEADQAKTAFLGTLSHELRTPMNGILGMAELLLLSNLSPDQRENVLQLKDCARAMTSTLNQLLEYSSLDASPLDVTLHEFAPLPFLEAAAQAHRPAAEAKGLALRLEHGPLPERILGATERLRQALDQLLKNAVAFTQSGSVTLRAGLDPGARLPGGAAALRLTVADTGPGIAPEVLPRLFASFTQGADYLTRGVGGLGLGLAACSRLAESLGGRLLVESEPGRGSAFHLLVPLRLPPQGRELPLAGVPVLLALGGGGAEAPLLPALEAAGAQVMVACGGAQAAESLLTLPVEAVVMAPSLPVADALALARMVRTGLTRARAGTALVVVLSPQEAPELERCLLSGVDAAQIDPADAPGLIGRLARLVRRGVRPAETIHRQGADQ